MRITESDLARFWYRVDQDGPNGCWLWTGGLDSVGYGQYKLHPKNIKAHRFSYIIHNRHNPKESLRHTCDVRNCVNPDHLITGSYTDNMRDMYERERSNKNLYTNEQVALMRRKARDGSTRQELVELFGGSRADITNAVRGNTYRHVSEPFAEFVNLDKHKSVLTNNAVREIKRALLNPYRGLKVALAKKYGVSSGYITHIRTGRIHSDVSIDS